jgi:hypothetical protein
MNQLVKSQFPMSGIFAKHGEQHMTAEQFIATWKDNKLTERGGAQAHFDDLCDLLGVDKPR